jgi:predicted CXXCH cytochrome family protein
MKEVADNAVHPPFAKGLCLGCHNPHASNNDGMILQNQSALCLKCHVKTEKALQASKSRHKPVEDGLCTKCHSPHQSKLAKLLLAQTPDVCLACHKDLKERMGKETAHPPAAGDCLVCHKPHGSPQDRLLVQPILEICSQCHDVKADSFKSAHIYIDATVMNCRSCHDPHSSADPKLFKSHVHAPFAGRSCDECHIVVKR